MSLDSAFFLLTIVICFVVSHPPRSATPSISLSATAVQEAVKIGTEAKVQTKLTNITDRVVHFFDANRDCDYPVDVRDENGNLVPGTRYKRQLKCEARLTDARNILVTLKPHESTEDEIVLTRLYEFNRPGKYVVQVERKLPSELGGPIKSNVVTIIVR